MLTISVTTAIFSTVMTHGRSQLADTCGRFPLSSPLTCSPLTSTQGLNFSSGSDGRGPALGIIFPHCPGLLSRRMLPSLSRILFRQEEADLTGSRSTSHHTGTAPFHSPDLSLVALAQLTAIDLDLFLSTKVKTPFVCFNGSNSCSVIFCPYVILTLPLGNTRRKLVCVSFGFKILGAQHQSVLLIHKWIYHRRRMVASMEALNLKRLFKSPPPLVSRRVLIVFLTRRDEASMLTWSVHHLAAATANLGGDDLIGPIKEMKDYYSVGLRLMGFYKPLFYLGRIMKIRVQYFISAMFNLSIVMD